MKSHISTGWLLVIEMLGKGDSNTCTSHNPSIELKSVIGIIGLF
jgi:hypothetical protein